MLKTATLLPPPAPTPAPPPTAVLTHTLPITLQRARKARRLSQLELSMRVGVSQRHLSFVETGRARPSRDLLLAWLQALDAPLAVRNAAMLQAGYAPAYSAAPLHDPALARPHDALVRLLHAHDPQPALVIDAQWNVLRMNGGAHWLVTTLLPWTADVLAAPTGPAGDGTDSSGAIAGANLLDLLIHPDGLTRPMTNLHEVGPTLLAHLRDDASVQPALTPKVEAFAALLRERLGDTPHPQPYPHRHPGLHNPDSLHTGWPRATAPVLTTRFAAASHGELAFFSLFTTFGTPQDITLASLRLEHMFAADEATQAVMQAQAPDGRRFPG